MTWDITVAGTITLDDTTTPKGHRTEVFGGSAVYSALAASRFAPVHVVGAVGSDQEDGIRRLLNAPNLDLSGVQVSPDGTFRETTIHDFQGRAVFASHAQRNAYSSWRPRLHQSAIGSQTLFLGSMAPSLQGDVLRQSGARLVALDSMLRHIEADRTGLLALVEQADLLFLNRVELMALLEFERQDIAAATADFLSRSTRLRAVLMKDGPDGVSCVTRRHVLRKPAHPVEVLDPTGAGDAFAGGFLGACARAERDDEAFYEQAIEAGLRCAARAVTLFGTEGLRSQALG